MGQLINVILAINKAHTVLQRDLLIVLHVENWRPPISSWPIREYNLHEVVFLTLFVVIEIYYYAEVLKIELFCLNYE